MSYARLLSFSLTGTMIWSSLKVVLSEILGIVLLLILATSGPREATLIIFKPWCKKLMKIIAYTSMEQSKALYYYAARGFVHLTFEDKFQIGLQMGYIDNWDAMREEADLEEYIFSQVLKNNSIEAFMVKCTRVKYAD